STNRSITVSPTGRVVEKARFVVGEQVVVLESGLPLGTPWSITVRGFTTNSTSNSLTLYESVGSYGFHLSTVPGFRAIPRNGGFTVTGGGPLVLVRYDRITPPPPAFPVMFRVTGLPASATVPITVRGATQTGGGADLNFELLNGSYAFHVGYVAGYHLALSQKTFVVRGAPMLVDVRFVPTVYGATFEANGTRSGLPWSVLVNGTPVTVGSAWARTALANGTYSYSVGPPANYSVTPRTGSVTINGSSAVVRFTFQLVLFSTRFVATGPPAPSDWWIRFGNVSKAASKAGSTFLAPNGTFTFDVHGPRGYYAVPSHGNLTVAGPTPEVEIHFYPVSSQPSPALVASLSWGALMVALWMGGSMWLGYAALRGLRRRLDRDR
ncbi:MAG: hypothetical protein ACHQ16_08025, partial [Candidatus Lutacidiplasmatales archaeon]